MLLPVTSDEEVGRNYGLALLFITPLALLVGELPLPGPAASLLVDRGIETAIGACLAVLVIGGEALLGRRPTEALQHR